LGLALFCMCGSALADPDRALTVDDVLRLHWAGVSEDVIISEIIVTDTVFELGVEPLLRLQEAGVSDRLIQFMVDTGLPQGDAPAVVYEEEYSSDETSGETWVSVIEEDPEPEISYHVSLSYNYPSWWYGCYWSDYWYYDCYYYPYRSNYSFHFGAWYPGWYNCGGLYLWPGWGYRSYWYASVGFQHGHHYDSYYDYPSYPGGGHHEYSQVKYKSNQGTGPIASVTSHDLGLKMRDGRRVAKEKPSDLDRPRHKRGGDRVRKDRVLADASLGKPPADRPVRSGRPVKGSGSARVDDRTPRSPGGERVLVGSRRTRPTKPTRVVREPAPKRPVKVYRSAPTTGKVTGGRSPATKSRHVTPAPKTRVSSPARPKSSAPKSSPRAVKRAPSSRAPSGVKSAPAPRPRGSGSSGRSAGKSTRHGKGRR
jgi:hypothetical protein